MILDTAKLLTLADLYSVLSVIDDLDLFASYGLFCLRDKYHFDEMDINDLEVGESYTVIFIVYDARKNFNLAADFVKVGLPTELAGEAFFVKQVVDSLNNVIKKVEFSKNKNQNETEAKEEKENGKEKKGEEEGFGVKEGKEQNGSKASFASDLKVFKQHRLHFV